MRIGVSPITTPAGVPRSAIKVCQTSSPLSRSKPDLSVHQNTPRSIPKSCVAAIKGLRKYPTEGTDSSSCTSGRRQIDLIV